MADRRLNFTPGVNLEATQTANRGGWSASNLVRFRSGFCEKIRGWVHQTTVPLTGTCRALHYWSDLLSQAWIGAGTNSNLYVENQGTIYDITPVGFVPGKVSSGTVPFSLLEWSIDNFGQVGLFVPSGGALYSWQPPTLPNPPQPAQSVTFAASLVGGFISPVIGAWTTITNGGFAISINGVNYNYTGLNFASVTDLADIVAVVQTAMGNTVVVTGASTIAGWQITVTTVLSGFSATLSYANSPTGAATDISTMLQLTSTTATSLANGGGAPPQNQGMLVTMPQQIVMCFGSSPDGGALDPLLVRWSDSGNYLSWEPTTINQAGSFRLPRGDRIVGAFQAGLATYIWTEYEFWTAQYEGFPFVFGFFQQGASCGLIAEKAVAVLGTTTYWMSDHGFFLTTGTGFQQIPCSVWDYVYLDLDTANQDKCFTASDYHYREVFFFFPSKSGGTGEIDSYVKYNVMENLWDTGRLIRTAWTDLNPGTPIGVDANGILQQHDIGLDDDGAPMIGVSITSAYIDIDDGSEIVILKRLIPDQIFEGAAPSYNVNVLVRSFPNDPPVAFGPFVITPETEYLSIGQLEPFPVLGARGREIALEFTCDALDSWFRLGTFRALTAPSGRL